MSTVIGVDPGLSGALIVLEGDKLVAQYPMPRIGPSFSPVGIAALLKLWEGALVVCEAAQHVRIGPRLMPKPTSVLYECQGIIEGTCAALGMRLVLVQPKVWQKAMLGATGKGKTKEQAALAAERLWPTQKIVKAHIDAALIACYGQRTFNQSHEDPDGLQAH